MTQALNIPEHKYEHCKKTTYIATLCRVNSASISAKCTAESPQQNRLSTLDWAFAVNLVAQIFTGSASFTFCCNIDINTALQKNV